MEPPISPLLFALLLLIGMLLLLELGRRFGVRRRPKESEGERGGLGTVEGAVFALFGLMVAFTFSGAASRFNEKRMLIAEEVNCIETAYLRLHLVSHPGTACTSGIVPPLCGLAAGDLPQASRYGGGRNGDGQFQEDPAEGLEGGGSGYSASRFSSLLRYPQVCCCFPR